MRTLRYILICSGWGSMVAAEPVVAENRGQAIYRENCMECHLESGRGIPGLGAPSIAGLPRWYVTDQLREFRRGERGSHDQDSSGKLMQIKAKRLGDRELAFVGRYIASISPHPERATLGLPGATDGQIRYRQNCASCHGPSARGMRSERAPPLVVQPDWYLLKQMENFRTGKRQHVAAVAGSEPSADQAEGIVAWLASLPVDEAGQ